MKYKVDTDAIRGVYSGRMTQEEFAFSIGTVPDTVSRWVTGRRQPSLPLLLRICDVYDMELMELMEEVTDE